MKLLTIPQDKYDDYRLDVIFNGYKWDPQFLDNNTVAKQVLVLSQQEHQELAELVVKLGQETEAAEQFLNQHLEFTKGLKLSKKIRREIHRMTNYDATKHIRLMRFDFHPTVAGTWAISEVNSDVPGGFAESSVMPKLVLNFLPNSQDYTFASFGDVLLDAIIEKVRPGGKIMLVHCTSYSDDRQVMQFLGDELEQQGYEVLYGAADHIEFRNHVAYSILDGNQGQLDAIIRFNPMEWVVDIKPIKWRGYFDTVTTSCNHPIAVLAQTKRFPFIWDTLEAQGITLPTWRALLPETIPAKELKDQPGFIYKPVCGRVGEGIAIEEACREDEYQKIIKDVKKHPGSYIAQKKFTSQALMDEHGVPHHVCLGAYYVHGKAAGYYARISTTNRIDSHAADIPVLIERSSHD